MSQKHLAIFHRHLQFVQPHLINVNDVHQQYRESLGLNGRLATALTAVYGSMWFVYGLTVFCAGWMLWQTYFDAKPFDPMPFALLLFIGNFVQLLGGPVIQVGQNLSSSHSELRAESDHVINQENVARLDRIEQLLIDQSRQISHSAQTAILPVVPPTQTGGDK